MTKWRHFGEIWKAHRGWNVQCLGGEVKNAKTKTEAYGIVVDAKVDAHNMGLLFTTDGQPYVPGPTTPVQRIRVTPELVAMAVNTVIPRPPMKMTPSLMAWINARF